MYLAQREGPSCQKYSFHGAGERCRFGFTDQYVRVNGIPSNLSDRALTKWQKNPIIPAPRFGSVVAELVIPTDFLSRLPKVPDSPGKRVLWIPSAPPHHSTIIDIFFTHDAKEIIEGATFAGLPLVLLGYAPMQDGSRVAVTYRYAEYDNQDLNMPANLGEPGYIYSAKDSNGTGRPTRLVLHPMEVLGGAMTIFELGGCRVS